jgi:hypothetical protein
VKLDQRVSDPLDVLSSEIVSVLPDGVLVTHQMEARRLILQLDLNAPRLIKWRVMWMRIVELARERDRKLFLRLAGFPEDLPNLSSLRPPTNSLPGGISSSWYARRQRGELPETY